MLSVVYPYFHQPVTVSHHLRAWSALPPSLREKIDFILVDDHSRPPLTIPSGLELNLRVFRVEDNILWNYGAKNLGILQARFPRIFLSELDHFADEPALRRMMELPLDSRTYYMFPRVNESGKAHPRYSSRPHPATFLFHIDGFREVGGLDEDFVGAYGYDDTYLVECFAHRGIRCLLAEGIVLRNYSENHELPDADLWDRDWVPRSTARNLKILKRKRREGYSVSQPLCRFRWRQVYPPPGSDPPHIVQQGVPKHPPSVPSHRHCETPDC